MRALKIGLLAAAALLVLTLAAAVIAVGFIDFNQYSGMVTERVKAATGRDLKLSGKLQVRFSPGPTLVVEGVSFANAPWGSRPEMVKVRRAETEISLLPLLFGEIKVSRLKLVEPEVLLETDAKGVGNWVFVRPGKPRSGSAPTPPLEFAEVDIEGATLTRRDGRTRKATRIRLDSARLKAGAFGAPNDLEIKGSFDGTPVTISGTMGRISALLAGSGGAFPLKLTVRTDGASLSAEGTIANTLHGQGIDLAVSSQIQSTAGLGRLLGKELPTLPPVTLKARLANLKSGYVLEDVQAAVGGSTLKGRFALDLDGPRPRLTANLASSGLDFSSADKSPPAKDGRVFSDTPFPLAGMKAVDLDGHLQLDALVLPNRLRLEAVSVKIALRNGRLEVAPLALRAGGGNLSARLEADASGGRTAAVSLRASGKDIDLGKIMAQMGNGDSLQGGKTELHVDIKGNGASPRSVMARLSGQALVTVGPARVSRTLDLGGGILDLVNPGRKEDPHTELVCAVLRFPAQDGVITIDRSMAYQTSKINVASSGTIDLRTEALDLAVRPSARQGIDLGMGQLAGLVRVGGTLGSPAIGVDAAGSARMAATVGAAIFTAGLSLLGQTLLNEAGKDPNPCQTALGKTAPASGAAAAFQENPKESGGGFFDRLFGR